MTTRDFLTAIVNKENITDKMIDKANEMILALDKKNEKRAKAMEENRGKNFELLATIMEFMENGKTYGISEFAQFGIEFNGEPINNSKLTAVLKLGVENGTIELNPEYKVNGKGRKVNGYTKK